MCIQACIADHLSLQDSQGLLQLGLLLMQFPNALLQIIHQVLLLNLTLSSKHLNRPRLRQQIGEQAVESASRHSVQ